MGLFGKKKAYPELQQARELVEEIERSGDKKFADSIKQMFLAAEGGDLDALMNAILPLMYAENWQGAKHYLETYLKAGGGTDVAASTGRFANSKGAHAWARVFFELGREFGDDNYRLFIAEVDLAEGNVDAAEPVFTEFAVAGNPDACFYLGNIFNAAGDDAQAREWWEKAVELGDTDSLLNLGRISEDAGDLEQARSWYQRAHEAGDENALFNLGGLEGRAGNDDEMRKVLTEAATDGKGDALFNLGAFEEQAGNAAAARAAYEASAGRGMPLAMFNLGNNARRAGDLDEARKWFTMGTEADFAYAAYMLGKLEQGDFSVDALMSQINAMVDADDVSLDEPPPPDLDAAVRAFERAGALGEAGAYGFLVNIAINREDATARDRNIHLGLAASTGLLEMRNVEQISAETPDRYVIPPRELRERVGPGDSVKLVWTDGEFTERMWTQVLAERNGRLIGYLDNDPINMSIRQGTLVEFGPEHILELPQSDEERMAALERMGDSPERSVMVPGSMSREEFQEVKTKAEAGDISAIRDCVALAQEAQQPEREQYWLEKGVALDDDRCLDFLGDLHEREGRRDEAITCWERAAELGNMFSMYSLGMAEYEDERIDEATTWWTQSAEAGNPSAAYFLSILAHRDDDEDTRLTWLERAIELGNSDAMYTRGVMYEHAGDLENARALLERGTSMGDVECRRALGIIAIKQGHTETGMTHIRQAAAQGDTIAMRILANEAGKNGDHDRRVEWLMRAAQLDDHVAMDLLGDLYSDEDRLGEALMWWQRAADAGNLDSLHSLGLAAYNRDDFETAYNYWNRVLEANPDASLTLYVRALAGIERGEDADDMWDMACRAAELGLPQAMNFVGRRLIEDGQTDAGMDFVRSAAEAGWDDAVAYLKEHGG